MKKSKKRIELDVDSIGNQNYPLTKEEEKMISEFIRNRKSQLPFNRPGYTLTKVR